MGITDSEFEEANRRGREMLEKYPPAVGVRYDPNADRIVIALASGVELAFAPRNAQGLENATPADLAVAEISPSGHGVSFPKLDVDLYIPGILHGHLGTESWHAARRNRTPVEPLENAEHGTVAPSPVK